MLTRFVRIQLIIFTIASVVGVVVMIFSYMQLPTWIGIGRITVTLQLPSTGGLYRFSNVTYRGVEIGEVSSVEPTAQGAVATLQLDTSPKIPVDLHAEVRSVSAVGEQYVELRPRTDSPPYLHDGSVIPLRDTTVPQKVGPMLNQLSALLDSIPKDKLGQLLDESFRAFNGAGYDLGSFLDSGAQLSNDANNTGDQTRKLFDDSAPFLDAQAQTTDEVRLWAHSLAGVSDQLVTDDPHLRTLLQTGPGSLEEATRLLDQVKPTLPVLLANLTTIGQIGVTYNPSLEQLLVLLPPYVAAYRSFAPTNNPTGEAPGGFAPIIADPPVCTVGFLPPSQWRSPAETTMIDTPDNLYCKLPQDSPIGVRGARNYPCMGRPGKRAPTVEICESDQPYQPLALRQHALGPYPFDPNLVSQGIPLDKRVNAGDYEYAPIEGTPPPPGMPPGSPALPGSPPAPDAVAPPGAPPPGPPPVDTQAPGPNPADPQALGPTPGPSVAAAKYDPATGQYMAANGEVYQQTDLVTASQPKTWQDLLPTQ